MHLLQDLVDVDGLGFLPFLAPLLLIALEDSFGSLASSCSWGLGRHVVGSSS